MFHKDSHEIIPAFIFLYDRVQGFRYWNSLLSFQHSSCVFSSISRASCALHDKFNGFLDFPVFKWNFTELDDRIIGMYYYLPDALNRQPQPQAHA